MIYQTILILHIVSGFAALLLGAMAAVSRKGGKYHLSSGKWYVYTMYIVGISAIAMTQLKPNTFLFTVGVFTLYLTHTGQRSIFYFRLKSVYRTQWHDVLPILVALIFAVAMVAMPMFDMIQRGAISVSVMMVFGCILLGFVLRDLTGIIKTPIFQPGNKQWLLRHIGMISGAYIATFTAFLVTNVQVQPVWVLWLAPTLVGTIFISIATRKWRKKLRLAV